MHREMLDGVIVRELQARMLAKLTAKQLVVVALRWIGMNNAEIAEELGVTRQAVSYRLMFARRRLLEDIPELEEKVAGRVDTWEHRIK